MRAKIKKPSPLRDSLGLIFPLFVITLVTAVLLAAVNAVTAPKIAENRAAAQYGALKVVLSAASRFEEVAAQAEGLDALYAGYDAAGNPAGWAVTVTVQGYGGPLSLAVGVTPELAVAGLALTSNVETPTLGGLAAQPAFTDQFLGKTAGLTVVKGTAAASGGEGDNSIDALSGATVTSEAVALGVNLALELCANLGKGEG